MKKSGNKVLGVIGGMGPLASQLFYKMIIDKTEAHSDQEHINMIILNHTSMPDRTRAILAEDTEEIYQKLYEDALMLKNAGADYIAVPCNTSHYIINQIEPKISTPFIHMIREAVNKVKSENPGSKVGILATNGTIKTKLYQEECSKAGLIPIIPSEKSQKIIMSIIYDGIKYGGDVDFEAFKTVEEELMEKGCQCAIMACTELSCLKDMYKLPDYYVDAMEIMAERAIILCGKKIKKQK